MPAQPWPLSPVLPLHCTDPAQSVVPPDRGRSRRSSANCEGISPVDGAWRPRRGHARNDACRRMVGVEEVHLDRGIAPRSLMTGKRTARARHRLALRSDHNRPPAQPRSHGSRSRASKVAMRCAPKLLSSCGSVCVRSASGRLLTSSSARASIASACQGA
jgi:hypothetical protein